MKISVIIPALNEALSIEKVIAEIPQRDVSEVIVIDNGSTDKTAEYAMRTGARTIKEPRRGYGQACLTGIKALSPETDIVVFLDGDYSDYPEELSNLINPLIYEGYDMAIGTRLLYPENNISRINWFGNWLVCLFIKAFFGARYTDLGPFRAIRFQNLKKLKMYDKDFGWTVEMQIKAAIYGLKIKEVPVKYRKRLGKPKVTGTFLGSMRALAKISCIIIRYAFLRTYPKKYYEC